MTITCLFGHTHIPIQSQVIAIHVRIAMFMLLCQACPFAHLLSFMSFWSHTHTYTKSGDSNTCENSGVHAALSGRRCALPPTSPPVFSRMRSEGFPFIVCMGVWGLDPCSPPVGRRVVFASLIRCL